ncbi:MAG: DNA-binding protein [Prevotella sp.]|nr:DNA-binding protein [Prevotella sp.]
MAKDLTTSEISRQNILNNPIALPRIREALEIKPLEYNGVLYLTKQMAADFYEVDLRTIENCLSANENELRKNGYSIWKGNTLKEFKLHFAPEIDFGSKITQLGLFDFRSFLNIGMLLTTSEKAKQVRSLMLDIVIAVINEKTGGGTKYINRRDRNYLTSAVQEENYHRKLTDVIRDYVDGHRIYKYSTIIDLIYKAVFCEKAKEYKKLLDLSEKDNLRRTLYAEVLVSISAFENHVAETIKAKAKEYGTVTIEEVSEAIKDLSNMPFVKPILEDARTKMASRDFALRDVYHDNIAEYLKAVSPEEYEKFIGSQSIDFDHLLDENKAVLDRLKQ